MTRWAEAPERREQLVLYSQCLDDALPPAHTVRLLDEILGRLNWTSWEAQYHLNRGQPAIHPRVLVSVLLYGLLMRLRSSRSLEDALQMRMDFRWLAEGRTIDHTTLSEFRRQRSAELKELFVQVCQLARELKLLTLERLGFDGTRIRANNRRTGTRTPAELREERAELAAKFQRELERAEAEDTQDEELFEAHSAQELPEELRDDQRRCQWIDATLKALEDGKHAGGELPKRVPLTDLDSRVMPNKDGGYAPNYTPTALVDIASGLMVGADVLDCINEDVHLLKSLDEVQATYHASSSQALVDSLNATGANLAGCAERGIEVFSPGAPAEATPNPALRADPTQPVREADWDQLPTRKVTVKGQASTQLDKSAFVYDAQRNCYWCPQGKVLEYAITTNEPARSGQRIRTRYQADKSDCAACGLRARCLQGKAEARQINREQYETHREQHAQKMATTEAKEIYGLRRHAGERPFAVLKQMFGLRRFLLRGLSRVTDEWRWAATAFNLHRLMSLLRSRAGPGARYCLPPLSA